MAASPRTRGTRSVAGLLFAAALAFPNRASAADWPIIQGTEVGQPESPLRLFGFAQVTTEWIADGRVGALESKALAPYSGERPAFNTLEDGSTWGVVVRRARPGLRGAIPGTDRRVSYFLLAELGSAAIARDGPTLTDAAITLSYIPGARVRLGQFKLPMMDETVEANPIAAEWVNFSLPAAALVLENEVKGGRFVGNASGFRDVGAQVFDTFQWKKLALSYAVMASNGNRRLDSDDAKDVTARTSVAWVFSGAASDPHRQELAAFAWAQRGERNVDGVDVQRTRSGAGVHLELEPIRIRAEVVHAIGALTLGPNPPFPGSPIAVAPTGRAVGGYLQARVRVLPRLRLGLRYDELHRQIEDDAALRVFRSLTPMVEYDVVPRVRLQATYEHRFIDAPHGSADARAIVASAAGRAAAQVTVVF